MVGFAWTPEQLHTAGYIRLHSCLVVFINLGVIICNVLEYILLKQQPFNNHLMWLQLSSLASSLCSQFKLRAY